MLLLRKNKISARVNRTHQLCFGFFIISSLLACSEQVDERNILLKITSEKFVIKVPAKGKLEAVKETAISMPANVFEPQVIEWLAEENSFVKEGQVVARFDSQKYTYQSQQEQFEIDKSKIGFQTKEQVLANERGEISSDRHLINEELKIAEQYSTQDLTVYSRNEIIDSMKNQQYLESKRDYTGWRAESHQEKSLSELELLKLQQGQHTAKLTMYTNALNQLEVTAPHEGLFVLASNWQGDKPRVGDTTWPGRKIASLPDLTQLQAKIFILESEAAGIKVEQSVELRLDAYPDQLILGKIAQLDSIAKPKERNSPVKYFEAIVAIEGEKNPDWRPGSQLQASIQIANLDQVISIPTQAITSENGKYFVSVSDNNQWIQREVNLGKRSSAKTEITDGLNTDDVIRLFPNLENQGEKNAVL